MLRSTNPNHCAVLTTFSTRNNATNPRPSDSTTNFGFEKVAESEKVKKVFEVFQNVSNKYDTMNDAMSLGVHRLWKDEFVRILGPTPGSKILDVAGGTGDIAFRLLLALATQEDKDLVLPQETDQQVDPITVVGKAIFDTVAHSVVNQVAHSVAHSVVNQVTGDTSKVPSRKPESAMNESSYASSSSSSSSSSDEEDELLSADLPPVAPMASSDPKVEASMEALRQKTGRFSTQDFDFEALEELDLDADGENAVEKGGLFVAGNIAGAKGQQISLSNFSDGPLGKVFRNDPHFVTSEHGEEEGEEEDVVVTPVAPPAFLDGASNEAAVDDMKNLKIEDTAALDDLSLDFDNLDIDDSLRNELLYNEGYVSKPRSKRTIRASSQEPIKADPTYGGAEVTSVETISEGDPNAYAEGFGVGDLEFGSTTDFGSAGGIRSLKVAPTYTLYKHNPARESDKADSDSGIMDYLLSVEGSPSTEEQPEGEYADDPYDSTSSSEELAENIVENMLPPSEHDFENKLPSGGHVTVFDLSPKMLEEGQKKADSLGYTTGLSWVEGNAEALPFPDDSFDAYTIAFGIRNCTSVDNVLAEAYRVLKPGGRFLCLEFSKVDNPLLQQMYDTYSFNLIPVMGEVIAGDWKSYQYLVESIRMFPDQAQFKSMIENAGFRMVRYDNLTMGVAAIHSGFKV